MTTGLAPAPVQAAGDLRAGSSSRLPGLDGMRGIAILAVLTFHLNSQWLSGGFLGVDIFFVISGFLITSLLVKEHRWTGRIDLRSFWTRRARRLLPALLTVVVLTPLLAQSVQRDLLVGIGRQVFGALTFTTNWVEIAAGSDYFHATSPQLLMNLWSLAVEEQFYLLWPLVMVLLLTRVRRPLTRAAIVGGLGLTSALLMAVRLNPDAPTRVYYGTDTHLMGLMLGAALAIAFASSARAGTRSALWTRHRTRLLAAAGVTLGALLVFLDESSPLTFRGGILLASAATAVLVLGAVDRPGRLRTFLLTPSLAWIGQRSYGIYLWHWPVILLIDADQSTQSAGPAYLWSRAWAVLVTMAIADLSFRFLETPVRRHGLVGSLRALRAWVALDGPWRARLVWGSAAATIAALVLVVFTAPDRSSTEELLARNAAEVSSSAPSTPARTAPSASPAAITLPKASFTMPKGSEIDGFGDSMMVGALHGLRYYFPSIRLDAKSNRQWHDAVDIITAKGSGVRRAVVLSFGTNAGVQRDQVERVITALGPNRMIVLVTIHARFSRVTQDNQVLREIASAHPNVALADWNAALVGSTGALQPDGIHTSISGAHLYSKTIRQLLPR